MVEITAVYKGQLHCTATHGPSGATLPTDAPKDNMGRGEAFSPTDLVATALGVEIAVPSELGDEDRKRLESAAMHCPVHRSLHPDVQIPVTFRWGEAAR